MKKLLLLIGLTLITSTSFAQTTPEAFIGLLPAIPTNSCSMEIDERNKYINYVDSLMQLIDNELEKRNNEMDASSDDDEKQIMDNISKQYGLSQEDIEKLQNEDGMTEEETNAIINKALQNKHNLSLDEINNLESMSEEGKNSWGEAYGTEKMAEVQSDPQKNQEQQFQNKSLYELTTMQKHIIDSIKAIETKFGDQFAKIDEDPEVKVMLDNIHKWKLEALQLMGEGNDEKRNELDRKIRAEKEMYCNKCTPKFVEILKRYESYTKSSLPVSYRLEKISAQIAKLQTGAEMKQEPGQIGIGKIGNYLKLLRGVFQYNLFSDTIY